MDKLQRELLAIALYESWCRAIGRVDDQERFWNEQKTSWLEVDLSIREHFREAASDLMKGIADG